MSIKNLGYVAALALGLLWLPTVSADQSIDYPVDNVRLVVPQSAGGGTDANARLFAEFFTRFTGKQMVVVNQKAGGGVVAQQTVLNGPKDGSQIYLSHAADHVSNLIGKSPFSYEDFDILGTTAMLSDVVLARADAPYDSLDELIQYAKAHPQELTYVTQFGGTTEIKANVINEAADEAFRVVDGGSGADRIVLLLGGNADISAEGVRMALEYSRAGKLKPLAVLTDKRDPLVPDWPTAKEQGYDISMPYYFTLYGPKGMNDTAKNGIDKVIEKLKGNAEFKKRLSTLSQSPSLRASDESAPFIAKEYASIKAAMSQ